MTISESNGRIYINKLETNLNIQMKQQKEYLKG